MESASEAIDLAIFGGTIVTVDPERRVLRGGAVGIRGNRIVSVVADPDDLLPARRTLDARGKIVLPGLIDTHGHAGHALTRGLGDGLDGDGWSTVVGGLYFHASDERFWRAESDLAALERLRFGVTTSLSMPGSFPRVDDARYAFLAARGYDRLGLRHIVAAGPPNGPWPWRYTDRTGARPRDVLLTLDGALRVTEEIIQAFRNQANPKLQAFVGPSAIVPELDRHGEATELSRLQLRGVQRLVEEYGVGLHAHAYAGQVRAAAQAAPELLGPRTCLAHCAGIDPDEVQMLARTGTSASHGPLTHAYAEARFPVIEALEAGVNVVVSTDGAAPDRSFDLLSQARIAAQLQRAHFNDTSLLPAGKLLRMITIDAARALGMEGEIGSLEPGKRADLTILNARQAHLAPEILAPLRVIHAASGHDVETVIVDGRVLLDERRLTIDEVDETAILAEADDALRETWERADLGDLHATHPDLWADVRYGSASE